MRHVPFEPPVEYHLKSFEPVTIAKTLPSVLSTKDSLDLDVPKTCCPVRFSIFKVHIKSIVPMKIMKRFFRMERMQMVYVRFAPETCEHVQCIHL